MVFSAENVQKKPACCSLRTCPLNVLVFDNEFVNLVKIGIGFYRHDFILSGSVNQHFLRSQSFTWAPVLHIQFLVLPLLCQSCLCNCTHAPNWPIVKLSACTQLIHTFTWVQDIDVTTLAKWRKCFFHPKWTIVQIKLIFWIIFCFLRSSL